MVNTFQNFFTYLKQKEVISLAIGVMIAANATLLTKSLVNDVIQPLLDPVINVLTNSKNLEAWEVKVGPVRLRVGNFLNNLIQFLIMGMSIVGLGSFAKKYF